MRSGDAKFVQIIHTDRFNYGNPYNTGDVNFLPNFGHRLQPGCPPAIPLTFEGTLLLQTIVLLVTMSH